MSESSDRREIGILSAAFGLSYMGVGSIQPYLGPYLERVTGRPGTECAWVLSAVYLAAIPGRPLAAELVNWIGARRSVVLGLALCAVFSLLMVVTSNLTILILGAILWGWGSSAFWVAGTPLVLNAVKDRKYGSATGSLFSAVYLGQGLGVCLLGLIFPRPGDKGLFIVAAVISVIATLLGVAILKGDDSVRAKRIPLMEGIRFMLTMRGLIVCQLLVASFFGFGILLGNFSGALAEHSFGKVSILTLGFFGARLACTYIAGPLSDMLGRAPMLVAGFGLASAGLLAAGQTDNDIVMFLAALALGLQMGVVSVNASALIGDWVSPEKRHVVVGTFFLWNGLGAALALILGSQLKEALGSFQPTFTVFGFVMAFCALLALILGLTSHSVELVESQKSET